MPALSRARLGRLASLMKEATSDGRLPGALALVARGDMVHVEAAGFQDREAGTPMRRDTIVRIASMTKPILAAAAMLLVEDARIGLDESVERWLPELADRRVLKSLASPLDDTVAAHRAITLRDLLTLRFGLGAVMAPPGTFPIQDAFDELGLTPGPDQPPFTPDAYMARMGKLPLIHQPGERWLYHTGYDVLAVLIARVSGLPLADFLQRRLFAPLGMRDTGFHVPAASLERFAAAYEWNASGDGVTRRDEPAGHPYSEPPLFASELVSTADDYLAFARMLLACGRVSDGQLLSRASVALMMTDQITDAQRAASPFVPGFWEANGWGFGGSVVTRRTGLTSPGSYGWAGGFGTFFVIDPAEKLFAVLLTQRLMGGPDDDALSKKVFALAYAAIDA